MIPAELSVLIPAYNEEAVIASVVRKVADALADEQVPAWEIVVVDDGSTDATAGVLARLLDSIPGCMVVTHERNLGYGAALRSGFQAARFPLVWLVDGDGQFDPSDLHLLLQGLEDRTMVCGYRVRRADPLRRKLASAAFFWTVELLIGDLRVRDVDCAFKLIPQSVGAMVDADGAMVSTEIILGAMRAGYRISEVPIPHYPRTTGNPSGMKPKVVLRAFAELAKLATSDAGRRKR